MPTFRWAGGDSGLPTYARLWPQRCQNPTPAVRTGLYQSPWPGLQTWCETGCLIRFLTRAWCSMNLHQRCHQDPQSSGFCCPATLLFRRVRDGTHAIRILCGCILLFGSGCPHFNIPSSYVETNGIQEGAPCLRFLTLSQEWGDDMKFDASDEDGMINLQDWPTVRGMYMPDAITTFKTGGRRCESRLACRIYSTSISPYWNAVFLRFAIGAVGRRLKRLRKPLRPHEPPCRREQRRSHRQSSG